MEDATDTFSQLRPRLLGVAYRMLGSLAEAEDVVQDVWLGWNEAEPAHITDPTAWLVTTTTRRSIDRLRKVRVDREHYVGIWLPEPVLTDGPPTPEELQESASDLSVAFLTVLALYIYGGGSLENMAISQMIGIVIGTISSIFIACPLLTMGFLTVTKQDLLPKAKDDAILARRP